MKIGGLQKFSLLDYPDHLSAIIFTQGCNFRCQFCYNPMLVEPLTGQSQSNLPEESGKEVKEVGHLIEEGDLFDFLKSRADKLDAIVITGGEPTMHNDLPGFVKKIRQLGFKVKLDTNGTNPVMLKDLLAEKLLNYIAMDLKAAPKRYDLTTGVQPNLENIRKSITIIKESGLPYEFRSTIVPELVEMDDIKEMGQMIKDADKWYLQQFKSDTDLVNRQFEGAKPYSQNVLEDMVAIAQHFVKECGLR